MKKLLLAAVAAMVLIPAINAQQDVQQEKRYNMYGVMFYNLENLFDTINSNGTYDLEFSPSGARQWDGRKYWSKVHNMAYAFSQMKTPNTPYGPAIIGVSEIENETVLKDIARDPLIKDWRLQVADYHESPDRRGVDVGVMYNPRYFRVLNVTNQRLSEEDFARAAAAADPARVLDYEWNDNFRTRDQICVVGILAGDAVAVMVNHWPSRLGGQEASSPKREAAGYMCRRTIDSLVNVHGENIGIIFMGDLNDDPMDKACAESVGFHQVPQQQGQATAHLRESRSPEPRLPQDTRRRPQGLPPAHLQRRRVPQRLQRPLPHRDLPGEGGAVAIKARSAFIAGIEDRRSRIGYVTFITF